MLESKFPTALTLLFILIILMAGLTWVVPVGQYERVYSSQLAQSVPVPGSFHTVESNPQGFASIILAPVNGFYDSESSQARAIDVALFVLFIGGFLAVINNTGAIDSGVKQLLRKFRGREAWMIPILMAVFAAGGTLYGMAEETLVFYAILIPVMISAGYDSLTGVAVIMLGAGIGTLGSTINAFATVIASNAAGIAFTDGIILRLILLVMAWLLAVAFVMRYAHRVKKDPKCSLVPHREEDKKYFLQEFDNTKNDDLTTKQKIILLIFAGSFIVMIVGVVWWQWWMAQMSAHFFATSIVVAVVDGMGEKKYVKSFVSGASDFLGVALIIGVARGLVVIMEAGHLGDTFLYWSERAINDLSAIEFINVVFGLELFMSFLVPSSSALAVMSMPILAPLSDFAAVDRALVVTAFQSASGLINLLTPTSAVVMGGLAIARVRYDIWLRFVWPLLLMLMVLILLVLSVATLI